MVIFYATLTKQPFNEFIGCVVGIVPFSHYISTDRAVHLGIELTQFFLNLWGYFIIGKGKWFALLQLQPLAHSNNLANALLECITHGKRIPLGALAQLAVNLFPIYVCHWFFIL